MEKFTEINEEYVKEILNISQEMFEGILYVKCDKHPCGWDSIDISGFENIFYEIDIADISNGIYEEHSFENKTLFNLIKKVGMKGWSFVPPTNCPDDFKSIGI